MRWEERLSVASLLFFVGIAVVWTRQNLQHMEPILAASTLFFELIIGALFIVIMRNVVGVKTFGVFGPVVVALGLKTSGLITGVPLYIDLFVVGMLVSMIIHPLALPGSFRVAVVQTIIAITLTVFELVGEVYHLTTFEMAIFFPVIVLSWLADRYVAQVVETGWVEPTKQLMGTIFVVITAQMLIIQDPLVNFVALNPESWLIGLIILIIIARSTGMRLTEYIRFKFVIQNEGKKNVLGINKRNRHFVARYNPWTLFTFTSKDEMKRTLMQLEIPTPTTYTIIENRRELKMVRKVALEHEEFVIKPSNGFGGEGIIVLGDREGGKNPTFVARKRKWSVKDLERHVLSVLDGQYSGGNKDVAILERRIVPDKRLEEYCYGGLPDIRVIILEGFPVMAMSRLPTKRSDGAANLHKGAIGLGLSLQDGSALQAVWQGEVVTHHPDTGADLSKFVVPHWQDVLRLSQQAQAASRLGYVGADIVIDEIYGPMILEVNKRPGLGIQNTNQAGLLKRLKHIEENMLEYKFKTMDERIDVMKNWDGKGWV